MKNYHRNMDIKRSLFDITINKLIIKAASFIKLYGVSKETPFLKEKFTPLIFYIVDF